MAIKSSFKDIIICVECKSAGLIDEGMEYRCERCESTYPKLVGIPVLIRESSSLFEKKDYLRIDGFSDLSQARKGLWYLPTLSVNLSFVRLAKQIRDRLLLLQGARILVVGSGRQKEYILNALVKRENFDLYCIDVDIAADVDVFADAHDIPFGDGTFDAVITTAVLEHVADPNRVVDEIWRVLKLGGVVYSELPFMQQVHEGAYDFTRFTMTGHRRVFRRFTRLDSGMVAGPGTALAWSLEYFVQALIPNSLSPLRNLLKLLIRVLIFWVKYIDYILRYNEASFDAASCTYFYGEKILLAISDREIVSEYRGRKTFRHI
jgi:SAM-dependent methyltransferase